MKNKIINFLDIILIKINNFKYSIKPKYVRCRIDLKENLKKEVLLISTVESGTEIWEKYRIELRRSIASSDINYFLSWPELMRTMFFEAPRVEYEYIIKDKIFSSAIVENFIGSPKYYYLDSSTSGNLVHHAYSLKLFFDYVGAIKSPDVIEIGAGYGSLYRLFRNLSIDREYIIFDFPEFLALQKFYFLQSGFDIQKVSFCSQYEQINRMPRLANSCLMLIALWSLSEMPLELRQKILDGLKFDYCLIAFQEAFEEINNITYFSNFVKKYPHIKFDLIKIDHLPGNYYLIGKK